MPQPADMLNLGYLSEYEHELILEVLQRDEELRRAEEKRVRSEEPTILLTSWSQLIHMCHFDENCCNHEDFCFQEAEDGVARCEEERGETGQWKIQSAKLCQVPGASESAHHFLEPVQDV